MDGRGRPIVDPAHLARIDALRIPPAWRDVRISPRANADLQATGYDAAGRKQYLYHADFRAAQEEAKFEKLVRFGERLPALREAMAEHLELPALHPDRVCSIAVRLINLGWFRVGSERYARRHRTFGICTLRKSHVLVTGTRIRFRYRGKHRIWVRTAIADRELADALRDLMRSTGPGRLLRYSSGDDGLVNLTDRRLNDYIARYLGEEFTAKDFRTWGGTLLAAIELAEHGPPDSDTQAKRTIAAVLRKVGARLGNTPAVARASYVSPAVIEQYLTGRTLDDFRPRKLRVIAARDRGLDPEEQSLVTLLRSWRIRRGRLAA